MKKIIFTLGLLTTSMVWAEVDHSQHSGHVMPDAAVPAVTPALMPVSPLTDEQVLPPPTAAELAAAFPDLGGMDMQTHMGSSRSVFLQVDQLEASHADGNTATVWEARAGWGSTSDRLWLGSSGERAHDTSESLETSLLWNHAVARWWDTTLGVRQDGGEGPSRTWAAIGMQGLAPGFFDVGITAFAGESGRTALRLEAEYEARLTNRLILEPGVEVNLYGKDDPERAIGAGLSDAELGLRLRYEIRREIAPYVGVEWSTTFGDTADMARAAGADDGEASVVAGIRLWY